MQWQWNRYSLIHSLRQIFNNKQTVLYTVLCLQPLTVVGFNGDGYLELASHALKKKASFGFVFATAQSDALLMLSTFEGLVCK